MEVKEEEDLKGLLKNMYCQMVVQYEVQNPVGLDGRVVSRCLTLVIDREDAAPLNLGDTLHVSPAHTWIPNWFLQYCGVQGQFNPESDDHQTLLEGGLRACSCKAIILKEDVTPKWAQSGVVRRRRAQQGNWAAITRLPTTWRLVEALYMNNPDIPLLHRHCQVVPNKRELELFWTYLQEPAQRLAIENRPPMFRLEVLRQGVLDRMGHEPGWAFCKYQSMVNILEFSTGANYHEGDPILKDSQRETLLGSLSQESLMRHYQLACQAYAAKEDLQAAYRDERQAREEEVPDDMATLTTEMGTVWGLWENMTPRGVDRFYRARHNIFARKFLEYFDLPWIAMDVDIGRETQYVGEHSVLTPDYIHRDDNELVFNIYEFTVVNGDPEVALQEKLEKYRPLEEALARHFLTLPQDHPFVGYHCHLIVVAIGMERERRVRVMSNSPLQGFDQFLAGDEDSRTLSMVSEAVRGTRASREFNEMRGRGNLAGLVRRDRALLAFSESMMKALSDFLLLPDWRLPNMDQYKLMPPSELNRVRFQEMRFYNEYKRRLETLMTPAEMEAAINRYIRHQNFPESIRRFIGRGVEGVQERIDQVKAAEEVLARECRARNYTKLPKTFKLPFMSESMALRYREGMSRDCNIYPKIQVLDDGTNIMAPHLELEGANQDPSDPDELKEAQREGLHMHYERDLGMLEELGDLLMDDGDEAGLEERILEGEMYQTRHFRRLFQTKLWEMICFWDDLVRNICYMEGRRSYGGTTEDRGHTVFKLFPKYGLFLRRGVRITKEKQIKFRVYYLPKFEVERREGLLEDVHCHSWKSRDSYNSLSTKWLAISLADLQHFLKLKAFAVSLFSEIQDKVAESGREEARLQEFPWRFYVNMMIVAMEHKRGTSTTLQLNRYIYHSFTAYMSNRLDLINDINKDPVRSWVEGAMRARQIRWAELLLGRLQNTLIDRLRKMTSTDTDYDRVVTASMMGDGDVEFSLSMMEMYAGNMFNKDSGFISHRVKGAMRKMIKSERKFQACKHELDGIFKYAPRDFLPREDTPFSFCEDYVILASKHYFSQPKMRLALSKAMMVAISTTVRAGMKLKSSLKAAPYQSDAIDWADQTTTEKAFITLFQEVERMETAALISMIQKMDSLEAIFSAFPKAQIGGAREISIQAVKLRVFVLFMETFMGIVAKENPKDMLGNDTMKAPTQARIMSSLKERLLSHRTQGRSCQILSFNMDSSGWSPNFVMEHFVAFVMAMGLPQELETLFCSIIMSFSHKIVMTPISLLKKWEKKPDTQLENDPDMEAFRQWTRDNGGYIFLQSSMGQGMFHKLSNLYHVVMDDMCTLMCNRILKKMHNVDVEETTLITSDDKTKILFFKYQDTRSFVHALETYVLVVDACSRMSNIHINMKKSALQLLLCEFNSLFSIGKRMEMATIKDIYSACSIPDYTCPEDAVAFCIGGIRRCLEHGCYLPTLRVIADQCSRMMKSAYRYDEGILRRLCALLNCRESQLPPHLGFITQEYLLEVLLFGQDICCFRPDNSLSLQRFYKGLFTAHAQWGNMQIDERVLNLETMLGKFQLELPMRLDKRLLNMKRQYYNETLRVPMEEVLALFDKMALTPFQMMTSMDQFATHSYFGLMGVKRKYEFQETMTVHSLIRALSMATGKGEIHPRSQELSRIKERIAALGGRNVKTRNETAELTLLKAAEREFQMDAVGFAERMMDRSELPSSLKLLQGYDRVMRAAEQIRLEMEEMAPDRRFSHKTCRSLSFQTSSIGFNARPEEMIRCLFMQGDNEPTRVIEAVLLLLEAAGVAPMDLGQLNNPFALVRQAMRGTEFPFKCFMEFCKHFQRSYNFNSVDMLSEFPCGGNFSENMRSLYQYRTRPDAILVQQQETAGTHRDMLFQTQLTLNQVNWNDPEMGPREAVEAVDKRITMCRKIGKMISYHGEGASVETVRTNKVIFRMVKVGRDRVLYWWYRDLIGRMYVHRNDVFCSIVSCNERVIVNRYRVFFKLMRMDLNKYLNAGKRVVWLTDDFHIEEFNDLHYSVAVIPLRMNLERLRSHWRLKVVLGNNINDIRSEGFLNRNIRLPEIEEDVIFEAQHHYVLSNRHLDMQIGRMTINLRDLKEGNTPLDEVVRQLRLSGLLEGMNFGALEADEDPLMDDALFFQAAMMGYAEVGIGTAFLEGAAQAVDEEEGDVVEDPDGFLFHADVFDHDHAEDLIRAAAMFEENALGVQAAMPEELMHPDHQHHLINLLEAILSTAFQNIFRVSLSVLKHLVMMARRANDPNRVAQLVFNAVRNAYWQEYQQELDPVVTFLLMASCMKKFSVLVGCSIPRNFVYRRIQPSRPLFERRPRPDDQGFEEF